jgi:hypothetical protein
MGKGYKPKPVPKPTYNSEKASVNQSLQNEVGYLNSRFWGGRYKDIYTQQKEILLGKQTALDKLNGSDWLTKAKNYFGETILGDIKSNKKYIDSRPTALRTSGRTSGRKLSGRTVEIDKKTGKVIKQSSGRTAGKRLSSRSNIRATSNRSITRTTGR